MIGKIFKSKQQREMERNMAIQKALSMHRQQINKLQQHERGYMEKAIRAKKSGDKANLGQLCGMVAQTINQRRGIESQLLRFETILQTRDKARLFKDFASGMKAMARSVNDAFQDFNAEEVMTDVEKALAQSAHLETAMDMVLDRISASGIGESGAADSVSAADIEKIIGVQAAAEESKTPSADQEIDSGLKAIERMLSGEK